MAARRLVRALAAAGGELRWTPMPGAGLLPTTTPGGFGPELDRLCANVVAHEVTCFHDLPENLPLMERDGSPWIAHTVWESDTIPSHWPPLLNATDAVIVPCSWNAEVFAAGGVKVPIGVVPHVAELPGTASILDVASELGLGVDTFVVSTIGEWNSRKDPGLAVRAYLEAFTVRDPVVLVVKTGARTWLGDLDTPGPRAGWTDWELAHIVRKFPTPARIILANDFWSDEAIRGLHQRADCYITLAHAEGWGLGAFDAATHGVPVITPGYGGILDYLQPEAAYFVDHTLVTPRFTSAPSYESDHHWAEPDRAHAAALLRHAFEHRDDARARGRLAASRIARDFAPPVVAEQFFRFAASVLA